MILQEQPAALGWAITMIDIFFLKKTAANLHLKLRGTAGGRRCPSKPPRWRRRLPPWRLGLQTARGKGPKVEWYMRNTHITWRCHMKTIRWLWMSSFKPNTSFHASPLWQSLLLWKRSCYGKTATRWSWPLILLKVDEMQQIWHQSTFLQPTFVVSSQKPTLIFASVLASINCCLDSFHPTFVLMTFSSHPATLLLLTTVFLLCRSVASEQAMSSARPLVKKRWRSWRMPSAFSTNSLSASCLLNVLNVIGWNLVGLKM